MINLGDGHDGRDAEARDQQLKELHEAGIDNIVVTTQQVEIYDPNHPTTQLASRGIYIPSQMELVPKIPIETYTISAWYKGWTFDRAWYYWRANSTRAKFDIPVPDAQTLYEEHGTKLRIAGHCGCIPPEPPWLRDKFECVGASTNAEGEKFYNQLVEVRLDGELLTTCKWGEIDKFIKQKRKEWPMEKCWGGVENYDIDTQEALNALTHYLRNRKC